MNNEIKKIPGYTHLSIHHENESKVDSKTKSNSKSKSTQELLVELSPKIHQMALEIKYKADTAKSNGEKTYEQLFLDSGKEYLLHDDGIFFITGMTEVLAELKKMGLRAKGEVEIERNLDSNVFVVNHAYRITIDLRDRKSSQ